MIMKRMANNVELEAALVDLEGYRGAVPVDHLGRPLKAGESAIINLQSASEGGSHWVCASRQVPGFALFFDPFGSPPDDRVINWLARSGAGVIVSNGQYQRAGTDVCGWLCAVVLTDLGAHKDLYQTLYKTLDPRPTARNEKIANAFRDAYKKRAHTAPPRSAPETAGSGMPPKRTKASGQTAEAYCVKCRSKQTIHDVVESTTSNGRRILKGVDPHGHTCARFLGMAHKAAGAAAQARATAGAGLPQPQIDAAKALMKLHRGRDPTAHEARLDHMEMLGESNRRTHAARSAAEKAAIAQRISASVRETNERKRRQGGDGLY